MFTPHKRKPEYLIEHASTNRACQEAKVALHRVSGFAWSVETTEVDDFDDDKKNRGEDSKENESDAADKGGTGDNIQQSGSEEHKGENDV